MFTAHSGKPRNARRLMLGAGLATIAVVLAACAGTAPEEEAPSGDGGGASGEGVVFDGEATVGFAMYNGDVTRWYKYDIPNIEKHLAEYAPNVTLEAYDPKGNAATQLQQVNAALVKGLDFLLITPVEVTPTAILNAAKQNDVPVGLYLNPPQDVPAEDVVGLVGDGDLAVGQIQAEWALDNLPEGAEIGVISGDLATVYAQRERQGVIEGLQSAIDDGTIDVVVDDGAVNFDPANAQKIAAAALVAHPDIAAFIVANDDMSVGVINALENVGKAGTVKVIGLDGLQSGLQNMLRGTLTATVARSFDDQADAAAQIIAYTLAGEEPPVFDGTYSYKTPEIPFVNIPFHLVTPESIDLPIEFGNVTKDEVCDGLSPEEGGDFCS
ncbi:sugar ABC transporter substrate-binding protein [Microbacterium tumbae]